MKKLSPKQVTSRQIAYDDVTLICELDEQGSFVGKKKQRHWLWYAFDTKRKQVIAHVFGPRTDATCRRLLDLLAPFNICFITTDNWGSYAREVVPEKPLVGKNSLAHILKNIITTLWSHDPLKTVRQLNAERVA
ncbi:IS1 family transposase [Xenorhabdus bovienii]|uniref:IS1 family transposase n=1 Tax=Xenorhabdus bovienii TaxID=40576 RepID=UPI003DA487E5